MKKIVTLLAFFFSLISGSLALKISSLLSSNSTTPATLSVHIKTNSTTIFSLNKTVDDSTIDTQNILETMNKSIEQKPISENEQKNVTHPSNQKYSFSKKLPQTEKTTNKPTPIDELTNQPQIQQVLPQNQNKLSDVKQKTQKTQIQTKQKKSKTKSPQNIAGQQVKLQPGRINSSNNQQGSDKLNPHKKPSKQDKTQVDKVPNPPLPVPGINIEQKPKQQKPTPKSQISKNEKLVQQTKRNDGIQWSQKDEDQFEEWKKNLIPVTDPKLQKEFNKQIQQEKERRMKKKENPNTEIK